MSQDGQKNLVVIFFLCCGVYCFYISRNKQKLRKISDSIVKTGLFFIQDPKYAEEYSRFFYKVGGFFFIAVGLIALLARTSFSHTFYGEYALKTFILTIFIGGLISIIYSYWRFRNK